ncbi:MAG: hypothetical protein K6T83_12255 [Alicyclobacillus sp.]|nr:hypothetical protein [Alicyclobacillus sp.]
MEFEGRLIIEGQNGHQDAVARTWTLEEVADAIRDGCNGMIHLSCYWIAGQRYSADALSIGPDIGVPYQSDSGKLYVQTQFRRSQLGQPYRDAGDPMDVVSVSVVVELSDIEYISIVRKVGQHDEAEQAADAILEAIGDKFYDPDPDIDGYNREDMLVGIRDVIARTVRQAMRRFVLVVSNGGIIDHVRYDMDLRALILEAQRLADNMLFDPGSDDILIFDADGNEVYVYPNPGELEEEGMGVYYCPRCVSAERVKVASVIGCERCGTMMERLDTALPVNQE